PIRGDPDRQANDEQPGDRQANQDGAGDHAPNIQDEDGHGGDRHDDGGVDDPLDDDGAEGRRPADPLAVAQVVAPDELAQASRQDVVGEVANEQVAQDRAVVNALDRQDQPLPAQGPDQDVARQADEADQEPGRIGTSDDCPGPAQADLPQHDPDREDRDRQADPAPQDRSVPAALPVSRSCGRGPSTSPSAGSGSCGACSE